MQGTNFNEVARQAKEHTWSHYTRHKSYGDLDNFRIIVEGYDNYYVDEKGKRYLDATGGSHCCLVGHGRQEIVDAIYEQLKAVDYASGLVATHVPTAQLSAKLAELAPGKLTKTYYSLSATEAIEDALKMAIQYQAQAGYRGKYKVLYRDGAHHGFTFGAAAVSGDVAIRNPIFDAVDPPIGVVVPEAHAYRCKFCVGDCNLGCAQAIEEVIQREGPETIAAFMMEPMAKGAIMPHPDYWSTIRNICDKYGILIIADEAVTGFGRSGTLFGVDHFGLEPDFMLFGKTLASGYQPIGATVTTTEIADKFIGEGNQLVMAHTLGGHPAGTAAALANINIIERDNLVERSRKMGDYLYTQLQTLMEHPIVGEVRGVGLLAAVDLVKDKKTKEPLGDSKGDDTATSQSNIGRKMTRFMLDNGLFFHTNGSRFEIHPCLTISEDEIDQMVSILDRTISYAEKELSIK